MEAQAWLVEWFRRRGSVLEPGTDYFKAGAIDSLAVVQLVADIEKNFPVRLTDKHYQDPRFSTLAGLAEIIGELRAPRVP